MNTVIKLFSTGWRRVSSMNWKTSSGGRWGKNWRSLEPGDDILTTTRILVSGIFRQLTTFVAVLDVLTKFYEDREFFLLQRKCMMSALIEIIFYWTWVIILVWENEPKLKETTVYTCSENSESLKRCGRIVWASLISALEVARWEYLPHCFSPTFQPPLFSVEKKKKEF